MSTVEEFISMRKSIETVIDQVTLSSKQGMTGSEREQLGRASAQLKELTAMVSNEVQATALDRLTRQLSSLEAKIEAAAAKKSSGRKPSGSSRSGRKPAERKIEPPPRPAVEEDPIIVIFERP